MNEGKDTNISKRIDLQRWIDEREHLKDSFVGIGYNLCISKYERGKLSSDVPEPKHIPKLSGTAARAQQRAHRELTTEEGEVVYLALPAFDQATCCAAEFSLAAVSEEYFCIVDSGTTISIADLSVNKFDYFNPAASANIKGFNGSISKSMGSGTILGFTENDKGHRITLRVPQVHQVKGAPHQLLSVSVMVRDGYEFHFGQPESYMLTPGKDKVLMVEKSGLFWLKLKRAVGPAACNLMVKAPSSDAAVAVDDEHLNLYVTETEDDTDFTSTCSNAQCDKCNLARRVRGQHVALDLLHKRLNHVDVQTILKMNKAGSIPFNVTGKTIPVCQVCETAKAHRRSVPKSREHEPDTVKPFERVWTDLKGKVDKDFWGNQYIITFTCEVTRWTLVGFIKKKSDAKDVYKKVIEWTQLRGYRIRLLNSDSGGEYTASENATFISDFQKLSKANGIVQNFTSANTPEQNGVSERLNRTLLESGRALLINASLAKEFWSLAVKHVLFVKNRVWHRKHQSGSTGASPFEVLEGKPARLDQLRVWGCDAWKLDHHHRSGSWDRKAKKMIFVGIAENRKGWVLFDPKTRKLSTTYHCSFDESMENRRCALRDFDLRQRKAGPGASHDEERLAKLERCLFDDNAELIDHDLGNVTDKLSSLKEDHDDLPSPSDPPRQDQTRNDEMSGAEEVAYDQQRQRLSRKVSWSQDDEGVSKTRGGEDRRAEDAPRKRSSSTPPTRSPPVNPVINVPKRRLAIGAPQELEETDYVFLRKAFEIDLPMVMTQRNPKATGTVSRRRYESYKVARSLREATKLGATWDDIRWDYSRGWIDFGPTARSSAATLEELFDRRRLRPIDQIAGSSVNEFGHVKSANMFAGLSFEESIQQEYAIMGMEHISSLTHREQRYLEKALAGQTLTEFAHCCASRISIPEPLTVKEAMASEHAKEWKEAMQKEIDTLTKFHCFDIVPRADALRHGKLVKSKWVFKVKYEPDGGVQRFKARLVAKGFTQRPGEDYVDGATYSPVFSYTTFRTILSKAVRDDFQIDCFDLASSFVQQKIDVDHLFMETPDGYPKTLSSGERSALHVRQSLYGLKQASRLLSDRLSSYLTKLGFKQLVSDKCVFVKGQGRQQLIVATWVDDILLSSARENTSARIEFDKALRKEFEMSPWTAGEADWVLNLKIRRDWKKGTLHLSQPAAIEKLATKFGLTGREGKAPHVPMSPTLKLTKTDDKDIVRSEEFDYPSAVGGILYIALTARPDVAQSAGVLSRFMACPGRDHVDAAKQVIRYLFATKEMGITYTKSVSGSPHLGYEYDDSVQTYVHSVKNKPAIDDTTGDSQIVGTYADADLAGDISTRKSTSGYCMVLNGGVVSWSSKLQSTVALSTAEAETIAAVEAVKQLMHLRLFLQELGQEQREPSIVYEDNVAAIALAEGREQSKRAKHYQMKVHFLNEKFSNGTFTYRKVGTKEQCADMFTKSLPRVEFYRFREWIGVHEPPA